MQGSEILKDSLYLYGVDFMSTDDVKQYFSRYWKNTDVPETEAIVVTWINDSSCVIKLISEVHALKAYTELKLTESRSND